MLARISEEPRVVADFIVPILQSTQGHTMLLILYDTSSKWVKLVSLTKGSAENLTKAFREGVLIRFGILQILIADKRTQCTSGTSTISRF